MILLFIDLIISTMVATVSPMVHSPTINAGLSLMRNQDDAQLLSDASIARMNFLIGRDRCTIQLKCAIDILLNFHPDRSHGGTSDQENNARAHVMGMLGRYAHIMMCVNKQLQDASISPYLYKLLDYAICARHEALILEVLNMPGISINDQCINGMTPLIRALTRFDHFLAHFLLNRGANPSVSDSDGNTPFEIAIIFGSYTIAMQLLHEEDACIGEDFDNNHTILLNIAQKRQWPDVAEWLVGQGAKVPAEEAISQSVFGIALVNRCFAIVKLLGNSGTIDINNKNHIRGQTPLIFAAKNGLLHIVMYLLACPGIRVNLPDSDRWTPLMHACNGFSKASHYQKKFYWHIINALLKHGANPFVKEKKPRFPWVTSRTAFDLVGDDAMRTYLADNHVYHDLFTLPDQDLEVVQ